MLAAPVCEAANHPLALPSRVIVLFYLLITDYAVCQAAFVTSTIKASAAVSGEESKTFRGRANACNGQTVICRRGLCRDCELFRVRSIKYFRLKCDTHSTIDLSPSAAGKDEERSGFCCVRHSDACIYREISIHRFDIDMSNRIVSPPQCRFVFAIICTPSFVLEVDLQESSRLVD